MKKAEVAAIVLFEVTVAGTKRTHFHASVAQPKDGVEGLIRALSAELCTNEFRTYNELHLSLTDTANWRIRHLL